jgi:hypothetical protein|tara:strand:+ start:181 stop:615 length:435 start_codon:yes stop_codon:yes gene_type:complete
MSHYAEIDENKVVTRVIVAEQSVIDSGALGDPSNWLQTSYNTRGGVHYAPSSGEPDGKIALRKNYAGKGFTYDKDRDAFISPKPFESWVLKEDSCCWEPPVPYPADKKNYWWDENGQTWAKETENKNPEDIPKKGFWANIFKRN